VLGDGVWLWLFVLEWGQEGHASSISLSSSFGETTFLARLTHHNTQAHQRPLYFLITTELYFLIATEQDRTIPLRTVVALCREAAATPRSTTGSQSK